MQEEIQKAGTAIPKPMMHIAYFPIFPQNL